MMQRINGLTNVLGLIGHPVEHTMSPWIHNNLSKALDINSVYVPLHVLPGNLESAIKGAKALNLLGTNVTVPYKTQVMPYLDEIDEKALQIGAVNTIHYKDGKAYGYNTDAIGLLMSLQKAQIVLKGKNVCIIGAGGAARSVAIMCANEQVNNIYIVNRTLEKAEEIKKIVEANYDTQVIVKSYEEITEVNELEIAFQTTSIGMYPNTNESPVSNNFYNNLEWAVDLIYNPKETKFLSGARENGVKTLNGIGMLFFQAVKAYEIWHGISIPEDVVTDTFSKFITHVYNSD